MTTEGLATLSEYTGREARCRLVHLCLEDIQGMSDAEEKGPGEALSVLAARLGVSRRTVQGWAQGGARGFDGDADALVAHAIRVQPHRAAKILKWDLDAHRKAMVTTLVKAILAGDLRPEAET
jgi:DNA-binding transcriptional regulator YiaG